MKSPSRSGVGFFIWMARSVTELRDENTPLGTPGLECKSHLDGTPSTSRPGVGFSIACLHSHRDEKGRIVAVLSDLLPVRTVPKHQELPNNILTFRSAFFQALKSMMGCGKGNASVWHKEGSSNSRYHCTTSQSSAMSCRLHSRCAEEVA